VLRSQDLIFTLYGDYIRHRGGEAWTGSLIELLGLLGMSEQAVRSALSRMSRKGWLKGRRVGNKSFYSLTPKSIKLLEEGAQRIFQPRADEWDGKWCLLTYSIPEKKRSLRNKLREKLTWLGYAPLNHATWISPRILRPKLEGLLDSLKIRDYVEIFYAEHSGDSSNRELVARCWNLEELNRIYADFIARYEPLLNEHKTSLTEGDGLEPSECFVQRFMLVHEYRSFPYVDPNLPAELLPDDWLGDKAIQLFREYHELLTAEANAFVDDVFARAPLPGG
jgi:phenylacetic acid degradation operon negative regulatory protein